MNDTMAGFIKSPPGRLFPDRNPEYIDPTENPLFELVSRLLINIREATLRDWINRANDGKDLFFRIEANGLNWIAKFRATKIDQFTVYSFEFPNTCDPTYFHTFSVANHYHFRAVEGEGAVGPNSYQYSGPTTLNGYILKRLGLNRMFDNDTQPQTKIYLNQNDETLKIEVEYVIKRIAISISFKKGVPC